MYSYSLKWINPGIKRRRTKRSGRVSGAQSCSRASASSKDADYSRYEQVCGAQSPQEGITTGEPTHEAVNEHDQSSSRQESQVKPALKGKKLSAHHSTVLAIPTVFTPFLEHRVTAPWPSKAEMKYEGDDRIATDPLHGRFLPAPRIKGAHTINWMHRPFVLPERLENFQFSLPNDEEIFLRWHLIPELEFTDAEGSEILGKELVALLDSSEADED